MKLYMMIDKRALPVLFLLLISLLLNLLVLKYGTLSIILSVLTIGHLLFFRDPIRTVPSGTNIVSPADGKIVEISITDENQYIGEECIKIGIFLSIFNVHVTKAPYSGTVKYLKYVPGQFLNALRKDSALYNESNWVGIDDHGKKTLVRQMVGAIARRIYCDVKVNDTLKKGEKIGIICYGSRVECYIPKKSFKPIIQIGDNVKAGKSIIGEWV